MTIATPVAKQDAPIFRNLFTPTRTAGVSPVVSALWAHRSPETASESQMAGAIRHGFFPMSQKAESPPLNLAPEAVQEIVPAKSLESLASTNS